MSAATPPHMAGNSTKISAAIFYDFNCLELFPGFLARDLTFKICHRETLD
jgi:hypothetical protein